MEKYAGISEITEKYLQGKLCKMSMEYNTPDELQLSVVYEDNDYWYDYDMAIDRKSEKVSFLRHRSEGILKQVDLAREQAFEKAIFNYLFRNTLQTA